MMPTALLTHWLRTRAQRWASHLDGLGPLPPAWRRQQQRVAAQISRMPSVPPSSLAAVIINQFLWFRWPTDLRAALQGRVILLEVVDLGWRIRLRASSGGFVAASADATAALRIAASASGWWRLARGLDDPDRLFFDRTLIMEGDTELGLILKNSLDAVGPIWPHAKEDPRQGRQGRDPL